VQLDFNLPRRFALSYVGGDGAFHQPFVLHRALFGSLERFFAILVEHYAGAFPLWLAPVQARVLPVAERHASRAREVASLLKKAGFRADVDDRGEPLGARVRDGEREKLPYLLVVGDRELETGSVSVRERGSGKAASFDPADWIRGIRGDMVGSPAREEL
jgi:threonyl-tRNA synthetase